MSNEPEGPAVPDETTFPKRVDSPWKIGSQVSTAGTLDRAVKNAAAIGAISFAFFLKSCRQWESPPRTPETVSNFKKSMEQYGYANNMVVGLGNLLINLGESSKRSKSYECLLDDLRRCEELGLELYNFRPGSLDVETTQTPHVSIAHCINQAHKATQGVKLVMEILAPPQFPDFRFHYSHSFRRPTSKIAPKFSDLATIIANVEDKTRIGVCIDTCAIFSAGHDIRTKEGWDAMMNQFDQEVGLKYLCGITLNDSKTDCNSGKHLPENIGLGYLGIDTFRHILQDPRTQNIPLILETPNFNQLEVCGKEIEVLRTLIATDNPETNTSEGYLKREVAAAVKIAKLRKTESKAKTKSPKVSLPEILHDSPLKFGAYVSSARGVENAVTNAATIGASSFAFFLESPRKWTSPTRSYESARNFEKRMKQYGYASDMVLPHSNFRFNLGNPDSNAREDSYRHFLNELRRCEELGLKLYNFRPGFPADSTMTEQSIALIAECINRAHEAVKSVKLVMEKMPRVGYAINSKFSDLAAIIAKVEDKTRIGVCIDTCHLFSAGYDIRTKEGWDAMMAQFDQEVGLKYLCGMNLSDSKNPLDIKEEVHENIGLGCLGIDTFRHIVQDPRIQNIPLILVTEDLKHPKEVWGKEIEVLRALANPETNKSGEDLQKEVWTAVNEAKLEEEKGMMERKEKREKKAETKDVAASSTAQSPDETQFPQRVDSPWKVGAQVSSAKGVENAVTNAAMIGATSFTFFLRSSGKRVSPPLTPESASLFRRRMKQYGYTNNMVLVNSRSGLFADSDVRVDAFLDDFKSCEELGLEWYLAYSGSLADETEAPKSLALIADCINRGHKATKSVKLGLYKMPRLGDIHNSRFSDFATIIARVEDKTRIGVCLDTCNLFSAGYNIRTKAGWDATMTQFDEEVGLKYLCAITLGDSKTALNSKEEKREIIGLGSMGINTFRHILQDPRTRNIPLMVKTASFRRPKEVLGKQVEILNMLNDPERKKSDNEMLKELRDAADGVHAARETARLSAESKRSLRKVEEKVEETEPKKVHEGPGILTTFYDDLVT